MDHSLDPFTFIDWENRTMRTNILVLDKIAFSPWLLGIAPTEISKPDYNTLSNAKSTDTTTVNIKQETNVNASYYVVKKGDTMFSIAKKYGTTLQQICDWNGIKNPDKIALGQKLRVK